MEPSPDLIAARSAWRDALMSRESLSPVQLRELEAHLDDSMDDLSARGLSADEAFLIATRRLGAPEPLAAEFRKVGGESRWAGRARWMLLGMVVYLGSVAVAQVLHDMGTLVSMIWRDGLMVRLFAPLSYLGAAWAGVCLLRNSLGGRFRWLSDWAEGHYRARAIALVLAGIFGLPLLTHWIVGIIAAQGFKLEQLGFMVQLWSVLHLIQTAVFLGVLLILLRRYWQPGDAAPVRE